MFGASPVDGHRPARRHAHDVRRPRPRRLQAPGRCPSRSARGCAPEEGAGVMDRLIRITTATAVAPVAAVAAVISYRHAYELVTTHGETGLTARLVPFTVDGLILAASMLILDASRRNQPVPVLARWCLGAGITATVGAKPGARAGAWSDWCAGQ